jgi:hypothetical protein
MRISPFIIAALICPLGQCLAQTDPQPPLKPAFDRIFTHPTGNNGYEDLVRAGDIVQDSKAFAEILGDQGGATAPTLAAKRRLIFQPEILHAFELIRSGINKPITSPRETPDDETIFPELGEFRRLSRLIDVKLYVELADGRVSAAIDTLRDGLRFGYVVQTDTLISSLVSVAMDTILIRRFANYLDQLSIHDCDKVMALAGDWLNLQDPAIPIFAAERESLIRVLKKYRATPQGLSKAMGVPSNKIPEDQLAAYNTMMKLTPEQAGPIFDAAATQISDSINAVIVEMKKPAWERTEFPKADDKTPAGALVLLLISPNAYNRVTDRFTTEQAQVQMLGVHAAIRRYKWEHDSLPNSLQELKLGKLAIDPHSGKLFQYKKVDDKTYELSSVGAIDRGNNGMPGTGQRVPLLLPAKQ